MYSIELTNVFFGYSPGKPVLKNINLKLRSNKYICILGHNGSGKSTLSRLLMGLSRAWSGSVKICGIELNEENSRKALHKIGLIFQNPDSQFIGLTAEDDIEFGLENRNVPRDLAKKITKQVAKFLNIESILPINSFRLSGGQKQKVCIASILALNPQVIIFDESTSMLDDWSKNEILGVMRRLVNEENKTVVSITHDMEELLLADEIVIMKNGEVLTYTTPQQLFQNVELMKSSNLELPFVFRLVNSLKEQGININHSIDQKDIIKELSDLMKKNKNEFS